MFQDFKALSYIQLAQIKNRFKYLFTNPITAIRELTFLSPLIFLILGYLSSTYTKASKKTLTNINNDLVAIFIISILIIIITFILIKTLANYKPADFTIQDVHYLFPSPIEEKNLWIFCILKDCFNFIINYFFYVIITALFIIKTTNLNILKLAFSLIGILLMVILFKSLNFLIYSIKIRFNAEKFLKALSIFLLISLLIFMGIIFWFSADKSFFAVGKTLSNNLFILTSMKNIIMYPLTNELFPFVDLVIVLLAAVLFFILAVIFAVDYYEAVSENIELIGTDIQTINIEKVKEKYTKVEKNAEPLKEGFLYKIKTEGAFLYKDLIKCKRTGVFKRYRILWSVLTAISLVPGYLLKSYNNISTTYETSIMILYIIICQGFNLGSLVKYELNKSYIYLLPGSIKKKMLYILFNNTILNFINFCCILLPFGLIIKRNILELFVSLLALIITSLIINLSTIILHFFIPVDDNKNSGGVVETIIRTLILLIPVVILVLVYMKTKSLLLGFLCADICVIILVTLMLFLTEKLFEHVELR